MEWDKVSNKTESSGSWIVECRNDCARESGVISGTGVEGYSKSVGGERGYLFLPMDERELVFL